MSPPHSPSSDERALSDALSIVAQLGPAMARRDRAKQIDIVRQLIALRAPMGGQWQALARLAVENAELGMAREAADLLIEANDGNPVAHYFKAGLLAEAGFWQEGYALLRQLPDTVPALADNAYSRGATALYTGRLGEAREKLERATRLRPHLSSAWRLLATLVDFADEPALSERLVAAGRGLSAAPPVEQAGYYYALGKMHVDRAEYALAFAAFAEGGRLMKSLTNYDRDLDRFSTQEAVRDYRPEGISAVARQQSEASGRTIFVTGLPRSGTTLVEQILTAHSAVSDGAEINRFRLLALEIGGPSFGDLERYVSASGASGAARLWNHWLHERFPNSGRIVDKTTDASRYLGLVAALLPDAPIVWMTRDPLDCAWSCFRVFFQSGVEWSYDLTDIAFHFRLEQQLLATWRKILGDRLLVVPYEGLVADPDRWISSILAHCGLDYEPQAFAPHENPRMVSTASVMQVRRPINPDAIGSAQRYREFLQPFVDAY